VRKGLKVLTMSLLVTIIMLVVFAGMAFASSPNSVDCPNPDCPRDGNGPMYQHGNGPQYQYRSGQN